MKKKDNTTLTDASVSIIIPVHNAAGTLEKCLNSIFLTRGNDVEVIVVNDASVDESRNIALEFDCLLLDLEKNIKASNSRNLGASHSSPSSELLIFLDADEVVESDTISLFISALTDESAIAAVVGSLAETTPAAGFFTRFKNLRHHYVHQHAKPEGATLASGVMAIRKTVFEKMGGFAPAYRASSIEDIALGYRLMKKGHRIRFRPDIQVVHLKRYTLLELIKSDIIDRAIPWTALMIRERTWRNDLNTGSGYIISVILSWLILLVIILPGIDKWVILPVILIGLLNTGFLISARRSQGGLFALLSLLFLPVMYFAHGVGFLAGVIASIFGDPLLGKEPPTDTSYKLIDNRNRIEQREEEIHSDAF